MALVCADWDLEQTMQSWEDSTVIILLHLITGAQLL